MICKKCGTKNKDGMKFCKNCGAKLQADNYDVYSDENLHIDTSKSKSPKWLIISIIVVTLAIIGVIAFLIMSHINDNSQNKPDDKIVDTTSVMNADSEETTAVVTTNSETQLQTTNSLISVPNIIGMKSSDAYNKVTDLGLKYKAEFEYSDSIPEDYVISQSPASDSSAKADSFVTIYISRGEKASNSSSNFDNNIPNSDYIFHDSNQRYLSKSEISTLNKWNMEIALNEIYARYGRKFSSDDLSSYFNSKSWYSGTIDSKKFNESVFNDYERKNIDLIVSVMKEKGYR